MDEITINNHTASLEKKAGNIEVKGTLDSDTIMTIMSTGFQMIKKSPSNPVFDFGAVTQADSTALALLLAWIRYAKKCGKKILYIHIPIAMIEIAEACRLGRILSFKTHTIR
jgi:phospholipid transport system transporter-binding protein